MEERVFKVAAGPVFITFLLFLLIGMGAYNYGTMPFEVENIEPTLLSWIQRIIGTILGFGCFYVAFAVFLVRPVKVTLNQDGIVTHTVLAGKHEIKWDQVESVKKDFWLWMKYVRMKKKDVGDMIVFPLRLKEFGQFRKMLQDVAPEGNPLRAYVEAMK